MDANKCMEYIEKEFSLGCEGSRLIRRILDYAVDNLASQEEKETFILEMLDPIGFNEEDLEKLRQYGGLGEEQEEE